MRTRCLHRSRIRVERCSSSASSRMVKFLSSTSPSSSSRSFVRFRTRPFQNDFDSSSSWTRRRPRKKRRPRERRPRSRTTISRRCCCLLASPPRLWWWCHLVAAIVPSRRRPPVFLQSSLLGRDDDDDFDDDEGSASSSSFTSSFRERETQSDAQGSRRRSIPSSSLSLPLSSRKKRGSALKKRLYDVSRLTLARC